MIQARPAIFFLLLIMALSSCSSKPTLPSWLGGGGSQFQVRSYRVSTLPNGLKIYFVKDDSLPRTSLIGLVRVGQRNESTDLAALNSLTSSLLDQGTKTRDSVKLSEEFNNLGTEFSQGPGLDGTFVSASALSSDADKLLELYSDVLMNPIFSEKELARLKSQYVAAVKRQMDDPSAFASEEFEKMLFGEHPYGRNSYGTLESLARIRRSDVIRQYLSFYRPNNMSLAVVGQYNEAFEKKVVSTFSAWSVREVKENPISNPEAATSLTLKVESKKGLKQTQIRIGQISVPRQDPDFLALSVAIDALGGDANSRLSQHVRDDLGLTYSISSYVVGRKLTGNFQISTFTRNDAVGKTLDETLKIYNQFVKEGLTETELTAAKAQLIGQYPRMVETADSVATNLLLLELQGLPLTQLQDYPKMVESLTLRQVNEALRRHLSPGALKVFVYGDESVIGPQLAPWKK